MSTHASISMKTDRGYKTIYIHHDGYLEGVGKTLKKHYISNELVENLLDLGDLSSLGEKPISKPELWDRDYPNYYEDSKLYCISYKDRGEKGVDAIYNKSLGEIQSMCYSRYIDYCYIWKNNKWYLIAGNSLKEF